MAAARRKKSKKRTRAQALRELLRRMEKDPEGFINEVREWVEREEAKARSAEREWERLRQEAGQPKTDLEGFFREILRETAKKPENTVRFIGIAGRAILDGLERGRRTK